MGIPLSDTVKSMVKKKPEGHPLIIKLLLSLWLLYKNDINYLQPNFFFLLGDLSNDICLCMCSENV